MKTILTGIIGVLSGLLLAGAIWLFVLPKRGESIQIITSTPASIICHIDGAVNEPGVYSFSYGDRIEDAIKAASGISSNADLSTINLAAKLVDGQKIYLPQKGEILPAIADAESPSAININTATMEELCRLPGIGESKAQDIIDYRQANGNFQNIKDLLNVPGIGQSIFDKIEKLITIN